MRRLLKFAHTVATATLVGALTLQLLLAWRYGPLLATGDALGSSARQVMVEVSRWLLVPSLGVVVVTGLGSMAMSRSYSSAGWVWIKAGIGLLLVKAVISINDPAAREIAALVGQGLSAGDAAVLAELARLARMEWLGGWLALALTVAGIGFGVWRPRFSAAKYAAPADRSADTAADLPVKAPRCAASPVRIEDGATR